MKTELSFAAITPRSLARGHTGHIIARLLATPGMEFVGVRMIAPSDRFVDEWLAVLRKAGLSANCRQSYLEFVDREYRRSGALAQGYSNRLMVLFFRGENVHRRLTREVVGEFQTAPSAKTIRDTFSTFSLGADGQFRDFQPAVDTAPTPAANRELLRLFARYAESDGGVLESSVPAPRGKKFETTLVMIKPDNLAQPSAVPGNIISQLSTIGLYIVGARLFSMSVDQGFRFYGFLEDLFVDKLAFLVDKKLRSRLGGAFDFALEDEDFSLMSAVLKKKNAHCEVCKIIHYMTGVNPDAVSAAARRRPGPARCFALLYRGENTVAQVRDKLGATDPNRAAAGTIRADYGLDLMRNGMHASDSEKSAVRERKIVGLSGGEPSDEKRLILDWLR